MRFDDQEFRSIVKDGTDKKIQIFIKKIMKSIIHKNQNTQEPLFIIRTFSEIANILKSVDQSPILKYKLTKVLIYLILMGEPIIYQCFQDQVYGVLRNGCFFNRNQALETRGNDYFRNNKYYSVATFEEKSKIKSLSCKYIIFCLQTIYIMSKWLPVNETNATQDSIYTASFKKLRQAGAIFPQQPEFIFYHQQNIQKAEQTIKQIRKQAQREVENDNDLYIGGAKSKVDREFMNGVEYLQQRLKDKENALSKFKSNMSFVQLEKQAITENYKETEKKHLYRINQYEDKVLFLSEEIQKFKQNPTNQRVEALQKQLKNERIRTQILQKQVQFLRAQNSQLITKLKNHHSSSVNSQYHQKSQLRKQILSSCKEINQNEPFFHSKKQPIHFYKFKQARQKFYPYYDAMPKQLQLRFRKSLFKSKQILLKAKDIQMGIITSLENQIQVKAVITLTNISQEAIGVSLQLVLSSHSTEIQIKSQIQQGKRWLKPGQQFKQELLFAINNIDVGIVLLKVDYKSKMSEKQQVALILPISQIKLIKPLVYAPVPKRYITTDRIFRLQKRIVSCIEKLKEYHPKTYEIEPKRHYSLRLQFLGKVIYFSLSEVEGQHNLRMIHEPADKCLSQKLLSEFHFILSKE